MFHLSMNFHRMYLFMSLISFGVSVSIADDVTSEKEATSADATKVEPSKQADSSRAFLRPTPNTRDPLKATTTPSPADSLKAAQEKKARDAARARGEITFDDLTFDIEKDGHFEDEMITPAIREMEGKVVRIRGFILPSFLFQQKGFTRFVLVRDNQECCFGPGAALYDCVMVEMESGKTADFTTRVVTVKGTFQTETKAYRYPDGEPYAVFKIVASEVK